MRHFGRFASLLGAAGGAGPSPAPIGPGGPMSGMMPPGPHPRMGAGTPPVAAQTSGPQASRVPPNVRVFDQEEGF